MFEWLGTWPNWLQGMWFAYVTFHDLLQWAVVIAIGCTTWGQQKYKQELRLFIEQLEKELIHVHNEVHTHIDEDTKLHAKLGQSGISKGKPHG